MNRFKDLRIHIIDDDPEIHVIFSLILKEHSQHIHFSHSPEEALKCDLGFDIVYIDMNYDSYKRDGSEGLELIKKLSKRDPKPIYFCMTSYGEVNLAVQAMQNGAIDFIEKPLRKERILATLHSASDMISSRQQVDLLEAKTNADNLNVKDIIGNSEIIQRLKHSVQRVSQSEASVLIRGENGTGKDLVAKHIHAQSKRKNKPYIRVDMGAINDSLFESEMFGHIAGSFTGAHKNRYGRMELANQGTLFLDEIGNLSLSSQAKLLRVLQDGEYYQVGSSRLKTLQARIICATNMPLEKMVEEGQFRQDLLFRINTIQINVPSLRNHLNDIPQLTENIIARLCRKYAYPVKKLSSSALQHLASYSWPGNIRELENIIERALVMHDEELIQSHHLTIDSNTYLKSESFNFKKATFEEIEHKLLKDRIEQFNGNISQVAKSLDLSRAAVYRRLEKHGLDCLKL